MPYLNFFEKCLSHLLPRIEAIYSDKKSISVLHEYKKKFDEAMSEVQQTQIMNEAMSLFKVSMWIKDIDSNFIYHNRSCRDIILSTVLPDRALFLKDTDFINNALAPLCLYSDGEVLKRKEMLRFIEKAIYHNGESRWLDVCKVPTFAPSDRVIGTMGTGILINRIVSKELITRHEGAISIEFPLETVLTTEVLDELVGKSRK